MEKTAREFINNWSESYNWEEGIASGEITPADMLANLKQLQADYEAQDLHDPDEEVDWEAVAEELESQIPER